MVNYHIINLTVEKTVEKGEKLESKLTNEQMIKFPERFAKVCRLLGFQFCSELLVIFFNVDGLVEKMTIL